MNGGSGDDTLIGESGSDVLTSESGTNFFTGGSGGDLMTAGSGVDTFIFTTKQESGPNTILTNLDVGSNILYGGSVRTAVRTGSLAAGTLAGTFDRITNFDPTQDKIDLSQIDANTSTGGDQAFTFSGQANNPGNGAIGYATNNGDTLIACNINGTNQDFVIVLAGTITLTSSNFVL